MNFDAVLFDCDGVLVDSEPITNGVLRDMLEAIGWSMSQEACAREFIGHTVRSKRALIEAHTGRPFSEAWLADFMAQRNVRLLQEVQAIEGIHALVAGLHARMGGRIAVASGADRHKVEIMLDKVGLLSFFEGRIFSGHEMPRSKPHPDVYLAAAAHLQVAPAQCLVVEDTPVGAEAGVRAGATVWAYATLGQDEVMRQTGAARVFGHMDEMRAALGLG